jgi:hypothetical protein
MAAIGYFAKVEKNFLGTVSCLDLSMERVPTRQTRHEGAYQSGFETTSLAQGRLDESAARARTVGFPLYVPSVQDKNLEFGRPGSSPSHDELSVCFTRNNCFLLCPTFSCGDPHLYPEVTAA